MQRISIIPHVARNFKEKTPRCSNVHVSSESYDTSHHILGKAHYEPEMYKIAGGQKVLLLP